MKILIIGLKKEKKPILDSAFPNHDFVVAELDRRNRAKKIANNHGYDLVISMSYFMDHSTEAAVIGKIGSTPWIRIPGSISNLKKEIEKL